MPGDEEPVTHMFGVCRVLGSFHHHCMLPWHSYGNLIMNKANDWLKRLWSEEKLPLPRLSRLTYSMHECPQLWIYKSIRSPNMTMPVPLTGLQEFDFFKLPSHGCWTLHKLVYCMCTPRLATNGASPSVLTRMLQFRAEELACTVPCFKDHGDQVRTICT